MKTLWNDKMGHRNRQARCVLVTKDGRVHMFTGQSIPGVCHSFEVAYQKKGKWSNSTWEITHDATTAVVQWMDDWGTGRAFPQPTWEAGYFWMAEQAPLLTRDGFEAFIREYFPKTAERWDEARRAEAEFGFAATPEEVAAIREAQARIAAEKAAYEEEQRRRRESSPFAALATLKLDY